MVSSASHSPERPNPAASSILPRELNPSLETLASACSYSRLVLLTQDYLKTVVPSQLLAERGANLVVINPGASPTASPMLPPSASIAQSVFSTYIWVQTCLIRVQAPSEMHNARPGA